MPGSATIDTSVLVDSLVSTVDNARQIEVDLGLRPYRVFVVTRTWDGGEVGRGQFTDVDVEITPTPKIEGFDSLRREQEPCGYDQAGLAKMTGVSLTYTIDELGACEAADGVERLIKTTEAHGQAQPPKYWVHRKPPFPDRCCIEWVLHLELVEDEC